MFGSSKKSKAIRHLQNIQTELKSVDNISEFNVWKKSAIGAIKTYAPSQTDIISAIDSILSFKAGTGFKTGSHEARQARNEMLGIVPYDIDRAKNTAAAHIENIIRHIEANDLDSEKTDKTSFWERHFTVNSLGTLWLATIALLLTACLVGYPSFYMMGKNSGRDEMQRQVNILSAQVDNLTNRTQILTDSVAILQVESKKCQTIPNQNSNKHPKHQ